MLVILVYSLVVDRTRSIVQILIRIIVMNKLILIRLVFVRRLIVLVRGLIVFIRVFHKIIIIFFCTSTTQLLTSWTKILSMRLGQIQPLLVRIFFVRIVSPKFVLKSKLDNLKWYRFEWGSLLRLIWLRSLNQSFQWYESYHMTETF